MQQVPAVEIDGITLSQSVSPSNLHPTHPNIYTRNCNTEDNEDVVCSLSWQWSSTSRKPGQEPASFLQTPRNGLRSGWSVISLPLGYSHCRWDTTEADSSNGVCSNITTWGFTPEARMKPHFNLHMDPYLVLYQHTHNDQSQIFFINIHELFSEFKENVEHNVKVKNTSWIHPLIWIRNEKLLPRPTLHPFNKFHVIYPVVFALFCYLTDKHRPKQNLLGGWNNTIAWCHNVVQLNAINLDVSEFVCDPENRSREGAVVSAIHHSWFPRLVEVQFS